MEYTLLSQYAIKFCFKLGKNAMRWKLDLLLWPRYQETEFPVKACWLSQTQEGQTKQSYPQTFHDPFFWQYWHDLHALGSHWTDSQLCWGFKGVQEEIPREEASTLQIGSVAIPPGQCTSPQLPIGQTLLPVTFGYSLSSQAVVMRQLRWDCNEGHWHAHTRGLPWGLPEVVGTLQVH